jgi:hypothetical protein
MAERILEKVNPNRRSFLKRVLGASFAVPVIASFSVAALSIESAKANEVSAYGNQTPLPDIESAPYSTEFLFDSPFKS